MENYCYTIIIPHYNSFELLLRMLGSIPQRKDIQVIVVDDCSKNDIQQKLKKFKRDNLFIYYSDKNHGAGGARNIGLSKAQGTWLIFADSDDMFTENAFCILDKYAKIESSIECVFFNADTGGDYESQYCNNVEYFRQHPDSKEAELLFRYRNLVPWNKMINRRFIQQYKLSFEETPVNNDVLFCLLLGHFVEKYKITDGIVYKWIKNNGSITRQKRSIEREYLFYIQTIKRNGLFEYLHLKRKPFYKNELLYIPFILLKHGPVGLFKFYKYRNSRSIEINNARTLYQEKFTERMQYKKKEG